MMATLSLEEFRGFCEEIQQLTRIIRRLSFPVIAAVDGVAVGAGCEIACLCDMRVGTDRVRMGFPEAGVGLVVTSGASWLLPRLVGTGWARRLLFTAQLVDAHLAERIGLLDEVVPQGELEERSAEIANRVASQSPAAIDAARGLQNLAESGDIESALQGEVDLIAKLKAGDEAAEGLTSFLERRKPRWANKLAERGQV
jgi:enoyl-CoA hydratase